MEFLCGDNLFGDCSIICYHESGARLGSFVAAPQAGYHERQS